MTEESLKDQVGLGVDIVSIDRMRQIISRTKSFTTRVFSEEEQAYCNKHADPAVHYATRFAAKEAVLKALGTGFSQGIGSRDVEVKRGAKGKPRVVLHGRAIEVAKEMGVRSLPISLSFTHTDAVAVAMAITEDSQAAMESRVDPTKELTKRFKDARALLDNVDTLKVGALEREAAAKRVDAAAVMQQVGAGADASNTGAAEAGEGAEASGQNAAGQSALQGTGPKHHDEVQIGETLPLPFED